MIEILILIILIFGWAFNLIAMAMLNDKIDSLTIETENMSCLISSFYHDRNFFKKKRKE